MLPNLLAAATVLSSSNTQAVTALPTTAGTGSEVSHPWADVEVREAFAASLEITKR